MNITLPQCTSHSVGTANQLIATLIQTLLVAHCSLSPRDMWPADHGEVALKNGKLNSCHFKLKNKKNTKFSN